MLKSAPVLYRLCVPAAIAIAALAGGCGGPAKPGDLSGRYIVTISDADMSAPALLTGQLGPRPAAAQDALTVFTLPIQEPNTQFAQIPVSNSVIGPPNALAVTRDGRTAFVAETRGPAPAGAVTVKELPPGKSVFAIDMSNPLTPAITDRVILGGDEPGTEPLSVDVHPEGDLIAVARRKMGEQIVLVPVSGGKFGPPVAFNLGDMGVDDSSAVPSVVAWAPDGRHLAVTLPERDQVQFMEFRRDPSGQTGLQLGRWGPPVNVGKYPYSGAFTPDGKYFIVADVQWGKDVEDVMVGAQPGQLTVIRLSSEPTEFPPSEGEPLRHVEHQVASTALVGVSPQGIAISPDGRLVVTANLRRSFLPENDPRLTPGGSLSLLSLDPDSGQLTAAGEYDVAAMPVGISFDASGRFVVATLFRWLAAVPKPEFGDLGCWEVRGGSTPSLENMNLYINVGRGPHGVVIVR